MRLQDALREHGATGFTERGNRHRCDIPRTSARAVAETLLTRFSFELYLMLAEDRRHRAGGFGVTWIWADPRKDQLIEVSAEIPEADPSYPSIATLSYPASRYEREIFDLFGLRALGHPDPRPLVRHGFWPEDYHPLRRDAAVPGDFRDQGQPFPFQQVQGEGIFEIPVGPVHAGIIEPGHFRFSVDGETIIDLKARLYYTHKGTEKLFEGKTPGDGVALAERISGDTSVGHPLAYCQAIEALAGVAVPPRALFQRVVLLELERLYNHVADYGAIANDTGFALAQAHTLRIRESLLRLNKRLTGHRLLRGVVVPGGLASDLTADLPFTREVESALRDFEEVVAICEANSMLLDRLRGAGVLTRRTAEDHGVLGCVARASGIDRDARRDHPFAAYDRLTFRVAVLDTGDVQARARIRAEEARESVALIRRAVEAMPGGGVRANVGALPAWECAFGIVEGWRGAILHWVRADDASRLDRVKVKDPSFVNWRPLTFAVLKNIVPDFPLCNKSFNLSYSGNDL
jgi:Ni,Fe-hydrogenase III large subunit/Ni,Fe-hydrogenase III component G